MKIAIGTLRKPKIDGIKEGVSSCPYFRDVLESIEFIPTEVSSDISHMPLTIQEVMQGAFNRARNLIKLGIEADYYIGIEGGVSRFGEKAYIFGCVYIQNATGEGHYGFSPMAEVPKLVDARLYENGEELGHIMGELSGRTDIRSENGSMGAWTDDMFTRKDEFVDAFKAAIAPFYNSFYTLK